METKRIAIIRNAQHYDFGGGERFPVFLANVLKQHDYTPIIISRSSKLLSFAEGHSLKVVRGWWWSNQNWSGWRVVLTPFYFAWQCLLFFWYVQLFAKLSVDVIHIQSKDDFIAATFAGKILHKRIIWTDHADLKHIWRNVQILYKNPIGKLIHVAAKLADVITVVSNSELQLVTSNLSVNDQLIKKITVIYNGVEDNYKKCIAHKQSHDGLSFYTASRLVTDKGIRELIQAFQKLTDQYSNIQLNLLGDGPEADMFTRLAHNDKAIHFLGHQPQPLSHLAQADVFIHPTYHEGFSVALVEASMLGLPIIATNVGGNVEIINNEETGLLVPSKNTAALCAAIKRLIDDPVLRHRLGKNARTQYEQRFEFTHIVSHEFIPLYQGRVS